MNRVYLIGNEKFVKIAKSYIEGAIDCQIEVVPIHEDMRDIDFYFKKIKKSDVMVADLTCPRMELIIHMTASRVFDIPIVGFKDESTVWVRAEQLCDVVCDNASDMLDNIQLYF